MTRGGTTVVEFRDMVAHAVPDFPDDLATAAFDWQHWPDGFRDVIAEYSLDVERLSGVHPVGLAPGQATLTRDEPIDQFPRPPRPRPRAAVEGGTIFCAR